MSRMLIRSALFSGMVLLAGVSVGFASERDQDHESHSGQVRTTTVTEMESKAKLVAGATQPSASGYAESNVTTVTTIATGATTTNSSLSVSVKRLTLANGVVVTFQLNGTTIGTGTVRNGRASMRLSTKSGATVPAVASGDKLSVVDPDGSTVDLTGTFGAPKTESGH